MYDLTPIVDLSFPSTYSIDSSLVSFPSTQNAGFLSCFTIEKENLQKQYWQLYLVCVVSENIHSLTMKGTGNSEGVGSKTQEIPEGRGIGQSIWFQKSFLTY